MPTNPYQTPSDYSPDEERLKRQSFTFQRFDLIWPLAFAANLIVPVLFSGGVTRQAGKIGMTVAILTMLGLGWFVGRKIPNLGERMTTGAILVALSQLFPMLHVFAGLFGFQFTVLLGGADEGNDEDPFGGITSEWGGFLCTVFTATALIVAAYLVGWIVTAGYSGIRKQLSNAPPKPTNFT